ncbi:MAG: fluoride exporter [Frankiaceae bacterium]|nr:fluoride exporter [Frankiaceae bacterium]
MASGDPHAELALDPDAIGGAGAPRPLESVALVALGGLTGTLCRYWLELVIRPAGGWPIATVIVNVAGAFVLGLLLESLARRGPDVGRLRRLRLVGGVGFCGAFTTYSALAVDVTGLLRAGHAVTAVAYAAATALVGFAATVAGIAVRSKRRAAAAL